MVKTITNNNSSDQSSTSRIAKLLAAAGFGGLGVSSGAAGIQQIIRGIVDAKRTKPYEVIPQYVPPKDPLDMLGGPTQSPRQRAMIDFAAKAKAGDVVLTTSIDELPDQTKSMYKTIAGLLAGRADRQHAHMIVPDANGTLRVVTPINERMGGAAVHRPLLQRLWAYGTREIKKDKPNWREVWRKSRLSADRQAKHLARQTNAAAGYKDISQFPTLEEAVRGGLYAEPGKNYELFTPSKPLDFEETARFMRNFRDASKYTTTELDTAETGVRRFLTPHLPISRKAPPGNCGGAVCSAYNGLRNVGDPRSTIPADLAHSSAFKRVAQLSDSADMAARLERLHSPGALVRRGLMSGGARGLVAAPALGVGAYLAHNAMSAPGKTNVAKTIEQYRSRGFGAGK